ncbi:MAG: LytR C-terminal domain-containing protein [Solirubrobacteraceae bacterium]
MASVPFALSVHNLVSSVGADAGFAAIIGLAILTLLYFAHARETANLREEAAVLAQRLQEAEARLELAQRSEPAPASAPAPAPPPALGLVGKPAPAAPAGVAAPALAAATRFVPVAYPRPATPEAAPAAAPVPVSSPTQPAAAPPSASPSQPALPSSPPPQSAPPAQAPAVAPAPAAAQAPVSPGPLRAPSGPPVPAPATVAALRATEPSAPRGANGSSSGALPSVGGGRGPVPDAPVRAPEARMTPAGRQVLSTSGPVRHRPAIGRWVGLLLAALAVAGAAAAVIILTSGTGSQAPAAPPASNVPRPTASAFNPAHVTVSVLNGTATNQLAHRVAARLAAAGYTEGRIATASNQTVISTVVAYRPGKADRADALHVAKTLHLRRSAVRPIGQDAQAVACPPPGRCTANVVVTVGADLAQF